MKLQEKMHTIDIDEVFAFLDRMEILEKEHKKMRKTLLKVRKEVDNAKACLSLSTIELIDKALKHETL